MEGQQPQISADLIKKGTIRECEHCGDIRFDNATTIVKISKLIAMSPEDIELPIRVLVCKGCGVVPEWSDPEGIIPQKFKDKK